MRRWEARLSALLDGVITVSPEDTALARSEYGLTNVLGDVPTGVDVLAFQVALPPPPGRPFTMGFLGSMDWLPNIDATFHFVQDILPHVRRVLPECRFKIIGRDPPAKIRDLALKNPYIEVTGTVDQVQPHVHDCDVIVVPLKAGGGTRIKIYEAMAMGIPVVSSTIGAEGLAVTDGENILLANTVEEWVAALVKLAENPSIAADIASTARQHVARSYSWSVVTHCFLELCERLRK
jgi:glycosyltransferase involved in cell wall biosynthesis